MLRLIAVFACTAAFPLCAADGWGGSMGVTSDYIAYGISQTRGEPAIQADLHYRKALNDTDSGVFAGAWASSRNPSRWSDAEVELDVYLGAMLNIAPRSSATVTLMHYAYPGDSSRPRYDYDEVAATYTYSDRVFATVAWSPDTRRYTNFATSRCCRRLSYEVEVHQPMRFGVSLSLGAGYADLAERAGYGFWNAGVSRMLGPVQLDVSYYGTDSLAKRLFSDDVAGSRWAASALWRFGGV